MSVNQNDLNAIVASLAQRDLRPVRSISKTQVQTLVQHVVEQVNKATFTQFDPVLVDDGVAVGVAWTTYDASAYIPEGINSAYVYCRARSRASNEQITIEFRRDSTALVNFQGARTEEIEGVQDTDCDTVVRFVPLTPGRTFDYQVSGTVTNSDSHWEIYLEGYM